MVLHNNKELLSKEEERLAEESKRVQYWKRWGPYLSERQWATVREDYSSTGDAWSDFPHEHARSRVYRWGEDGIAGVSDNHQYQCISFGFWNGKDKFLKERLFGLTGHQGNHGEDVKEDYYYLDNTPTHSYMKYLYKYPQNEFPYQQLVDESAKRDRNQPEFELVDTGIWNESRYFDIFIEMAKPSDNAEELDFRVTAFNRGPDSAPIHIIPQMWFRNTWDWGYDNRPESQKPNIKLVDGAAHTVESSHFKLGTRYAEFLTSEDSKGNRVEPTLMFTDNATNRMHLYACPSNDTKYVKDAFHDRIVGNDESKVNPANEGTKMGAWYKFDVPADDSVCVRFKFTNKKESLIGNPENIVDAEDKYDDLFDEKADEADDFYFKLSPLPMPDDIRAIQRQAWAGMLWTKQFYHFIQQEWHKGDPSQPPPPPERAQIRNTEWTHLYIDDVLSLPDKWEYPFFAAWDTAFHCIPLAMVDPQFAKKQLDLLTREWYMHPNGQIPAYEWNFSDVNPPVHAWATFRVFKIERKLYGREDLDFLERVFQKLLLNFTWWVNRKDREGKNVFEGGFLGLDNIGLFNRSEPLPTGGVLEQADSTGWMAFFCLQMLNIALELAKHRRVYEDIASKFFEHFIFIADAMSFRSAGSIEKPLWNDEDGFYYDAISWGGPWSQQLPVRSLVGLIPLYATLTLEPEVLEKCPSFAKRVAWFVENRTDMAARNMASMKQRGEKGRILLSLVNEERLHKILEYMADDEEFLSPYGIRSMSKFHKDHPFSMDVHGQTFTVDFVPGESNSGLFGGNSNWRGPVWFPTTFLLIESLQRFFLYYGSEFRVEYPKGSGEDISLAKFADSIQHRLINLFTKNEDDRRPYNGGNDIYDYDENFKDYVLFYEFFDCETGRGLGAKHQNGWTGLVAKLIHDVGISHLQMKAGTPKDSAKAADMYFDEVLTYNKDSSLSQNTAYGQRFHRRSRTSGSITTVDSLTRPSLSRQSTHPDTEEHVKNLMEKLRMGESSYDDELESGYFNTKH